MIRIGTNDVHLIHGTNASPEDVLLAAAYALPALEIVGSRIADWEITFADSVADKTSSALYVTGKVASLIAGAAYLGRPLSRLRGWRAP